MEVEKTFAEKNFLIVEDDQDVREMLGRLFRDRGAVVHLAENGSVGRAKIDEMKDKIDLIVSDVKMPVMDGVELLKYCRTSHANVPVIIITGFSEVLEAKDAYENGARGFLAKPFRVQEILDIVSDLILKKQEEKEADGVPVEAEYCRIHVDDFLTSSKLPSDLYVRVSPKKCLKVAREGTEIDVGRIKVYKEKRVDYFYVRASDFHKYTNLNLKLSKAVLKTSSVSSETKLQLFRHTSELMVQQIFLSGMEKSVCENAEAMVMNTLGLISENENLLELLVAMQGRGDRLYAHSLSVSIYASLIGRQLGWTSAQTLYKMSLAGIFHDVGLKEIPAELHEKPRSKMSPEEIKIYETHPQRSRDILLEEPGFPGEIAQIALQHHENQIGTGYPQGLSAMKTHPLAKVIHLADEISDRLASYEKPTIETARAVLNWIYDTKNDEFDLTTLRAAFAVFGLPQPARKASVS